MVNSNDFGERIQKLMDHYQLSASAFAEAIDTGRSSISHILSGRNKPSLDFVLKITDTYPEVDIHWLLNGKGTFPKTARTTSSIIENKTTTTPSTPDFEKDQPALEQNLFSQKIESEIRKKTVSETQESIPTEMTKPLITNKTIRQIIIFYEDGSFELFKN